MVQLVGVRVVKCSFLVRNIADLKLKQGVIDDVKTELPDSAPIGHWDSK